LREGIKQMQPINSQKNHQKYFEQLDIFED
jgi:hypothetical protein